MRIAHLLRLAIILFLLGALCSPPQTQPSYDALADLTFIANYIARNHPGIYNAEDPEFVHHLWEQEELAQKALTAATSTEEKKGILRAFIRSFEDGHVNIQWQDASRVDPICAQMASIHFGIEALAPAVYWISLPSFYHAMPNAKLAELQKVTDQMASLRGAHAVIFDLRGNGGGNDTLGMRLLEELFGEEYTEQVCRHNQAKTGVEWRASEDNYNFLESLVGNVNFGKESGCPELDSLLSRLDRTLEDEELTHYYQKWSDEYLEITPPNPITATPQTKAAIFCVVDSKCASAALDFIDYLKALSHPTLIGQTTSSDRLYMDVSITPLPSSRGRLFCPMKVYRNRPRGDKEPHVPDIAFEDVANTGKLRELILSLIDQPKP